MQRKTVNQWGVSLLVATVLSACGADQEATKSIQSSDANVLREAEAVADAKILEKKNESDRRTADLSEVHNQLVKLFNRSDEIIESMESKMSKAVQGKAARAGNSNLLTANNGAGFASGVFISTATGKERLLDVDGRALVRRQGGSTQVSVQLSGLMPNTQFMGHVHDLPCDVNAGGGHYKMDPAIAETIEANEMWVSLQTDDTGYAIDENIIEHMARPEAQAIVIHDADGARVACATLEKHDQPVEPVTVGMFRALPGNEGTTIKGFIRLIRQKDGSIIQVTASGLDAGVNYPAHLHNLPCDVTSGGGHYKMDSTVVDTLEENEVWVSFTADEQGLATQESIVDHLIRPEGQSVVVHDAAGARLVCADLVSPRSASYYALKTNGIFVPTPSGFENGYEGLYGLAEVLRRVNGETRISAIVAGLDVDQTYMAHVHNKSCTEGGGAHYKIDPAIADTVEANEFFLKFVVNTWGIAQAEISKNHVMRADARAIVLHEHSNPAIRIACMDI